MRYSLTSSATDATVCLLGHPIGHSRSPAMQNAAFRHLGLSVTYLARDVEPEALPGVVGSLRSERVLGANLTLPHKERVLEMLDDVDPLAALVGAVNAIVNDGGALKGYNTDIGGFLTALRVVAQNGARGLDCLVLGAGGAARAVVAGLLQDGAANVWVANRTKARAKVLCTAAAAWGSAPCVPLHGYEAADVSARCHLIVNATSLGLPHSVKEFPLDVDILHSGQVLFDLVYGAGPTELVQAARAKGLIAMDGKEMLVQQAALSFRLWTGIEAPLEVMRGSIGTS